MTTTDVARIRELRYMDGLSGPAVAKIVGCSTSTVRKYAPGQPGKVPNDKLRAAFVASGLSASEVARRVGWWAGSADGARVKRALGLLPTTNGRGRRQIRRLIDAEMAGMLAEAIGVEPWEVMPDDDRTSVQ